MRQPGLAARFAAASVLCLAASVTWAADRVALLIGNNNYASAPLRNAANDARDLAEALKEVGFQVIVRENAKRKDMIDAIREFGQAIDGASTTLFFYAGHAMQFKDRNYLIPIDAAMGSEEDVTFFSVDLGQIYDRMDRAHTRFNFIILDACRDNPFAASFKVGSQGLAQMSAPSGTLIAYATAPNSVAADGFGHNGIYTKHILQNIRVPDLPVEVMFKRVREGVERETRKLQSPWDTSSLKGDFAFNGAAKASVASTAASSPSADVQLTIEREFWISVRDSNRPEDVRAYIDKFPNGAFVALAKNRLDALSREASAQAAPPPTPTSSAPVGPTIALSARESETIRLQSAAGAFATESRKALVIGNDSYEHVGKLANARADARAIAKGLEAAAFKVTLKLDVSEKAMKEAIRNFKGQVNGGDVAVFYYSGHGVQLGASNYLLPTDVRGDSEDQVKDDAIPLQRVLDDLQDQKAKFSLAIVDACRNNPFRQTGRAIGGRGLAPTTAATGQMVLYSAGAGQQALDNLGPSDRSTNGLFTRVFLEEMKKPGVSVDRVLRNVREEVARLAKSVNHEQVPAIYDQALGDFYFAK